MCGNGDSRRSGLMRVILSRRRRGRAVFCVLSALVSLVELGVVELVVVELVVVVVVGALQEEVGCVRHLVQRCLCFLASPS